MSLSVHKTLSGLTALVWLVNGLCCKLFYMVPRHEAIVSRILGPGDALLLTRFIGAGEVFIALWVISGKWPRICTFLQLLLVGLLNILEFFQAPDLLLFGKRNALFALLLMVVICCHEFIRAKFTILQSLPDMFSALKKHPCAV